MKRFRDYIFNKPEIAITLPTMMCFIQFLYDLFEIFKSGHFDNSVFSQLISSANGFEAVVLCGIMIILKEKRK